MKIFRARYLLPIGAPPLEDAALLIDGTHIVAVGPWRELAAAHPRAAAVVFENAVILPPLVNAHTHLELSTYPEWCGAWQDRPAQGDFVGWIEHLIRVKSKIPRESYTAAIRAGIDALLRSGCGAVGDILSNHLDCEVYRDCPLFGRVYFEVLGLDLDRIRQQLATLDGVCATAPFGRLVAGISPHAPYTLAPQALDLVLTQACQRDWAVSMHLGESPDEVEFLARASGDIADRLYPYVGWRGQVPPPAGLRPVPYLLQRGPLPRALLLAHGVQVTGEEVGEIKAAGAGVVLCPRSNARLGVGKAPVALYRRAGVPLALGTDSLASSPSLSIWEELAFARTWFAGALDPATWLEVATAGGASVLDLAGQMGFLGPGREAHFQVVTVPDGATTLTLAEALCTGAEGITVQALYLGGERVFTATL